MNKNLTPLGWSELVGEEARKSWLDKYNSGFWSKYCHGIGLDIGGKGYLEGVLPITNGATIVGLDYPGYNGYDLPFDDNSQDFVYSSHCLEHIEDYKRAIKDWYRVCKIGGYIVTAVPHQFLYEKKLSLPSKWNGDHKRMYTPASLLKEFEDSLIPNSYRVRLLEDNDTGHDYTTGPELHSNWCYEILLVIEKISTPTWKLG